MEDRACSGGSKDVVAHGDGQGVHYYVGLIRMGLLEGFGQQIEERPPEVRIYGMKPPLLKRLLEIALSM